jgi:plastocyanin
MLTTRGLTLLLLLLIGGGEVAVSMDGGKNGVVTGTVRLTSRDRLPASIALTKDPKVCGLKKASARLALSADGGVKDAVISLEGMPAGKGYNGAAELVLNQQTCEYSPHVLVVPLGAAITIVNHDPILHNVHAYEGSACAGKTVFNIAQPVKGQRTSVKGFATSGVHSATCDAGHPWMNATIIVAEHPYYAVTDAQGNFSLDNVPPGTYKIKLWHEGVAVVNTLLDGAKPKAYQYEQPYEILKEVTVPGGGTARVDFDLALRESSVASQK